MGDATPGGVTTSRGFRASGVAAGLDRSAIAHLDPFGGAAAVAGRAVARSNLSSARVSVEIDLDAGPAQGWVWTKALTAAYVHENSAYSS